MIEVCQTLRIGVQKATEGPETDRNHVFDLKKIAIAQPNDSSQLAST